MVHDPQWRAASHTDGTAVPVTVSHAVAHARHATAAHPLQLPPPQSRPRQVLPSLQPCPAPSARRHLGGSGGAWETSRQWPATSTYRLSALRYPFQLHTLWPTLGMQAPLTLYSFRRLRAALARCCRHCSHAPRRHVASILVGMASSKLHVTLNTGLADEGAGKRPQGRL
jgi:hypothetical protein